MDNESLKRKSMVVIANPAAQNGRGAAAASWLRSEVSARGFDGVRVVTTSRPREAEEIASRAQADIVVALGGDGVIHEVACGLAARASRERPVLGVLPCGNGNDFARTLGMPLGDVREAWARLLGAKVRPFDLGLCNGVPFVQTLSFGLDAAIALGTEERRRRTGRSGTMLFVEEGIAQLAFHRDVHVACLELEGIVESPYPAHRSSAGSARGGDLSLTVPVHLLAVQLGRTYGGGFDVCPYARPDDGAFDIMAAHAPLGLVRAGALFLRAKGGRHLGCGRELSFWRARKVRISFADSVPSQIDGERFDGAAFEATVLPQELRVLSAL